ncbi:MAG: hypothetical protein CM1200mP2_28780 [Planctomycetaceae bacterium]|nr:MAG: hypothetical protein CM1200mP2_28780 [Planctomycetaceae bacterium]
MMARARLVKEPSQAKRLEDRLTAVSKGNRATAEIINCHRRINPNWW